MLRKWQSECADKAIEKFDSGSSHFFCQATPGAGKTVLAAEIAKRLIERNKVDLILCVSPSLAVSQSIKSTFSKALNCAFNGELGDLGRSLTYQALQYLSESFWNTLKKYRVFVVFDEIHHCSGNDVVNANSWGEQILLNIQSLAIYTLALSGTPWRTDKVPIVMAEYSNPEGELICDYRYSLKRATQEGVCRKPKVVLIDNERLSLSSRSSKATFGSIRELMQEPGLSYQTLIHNPEGLRYILKLGAEKLEEVRSYFPEAGGLIVASSVKHAEMILEILTVECGLSATIVTYQHENALEKIEAFKQSSTPWIVSVGMISEGTDIPRLQVCCHISAVKTELYFRQVLGRILRVNSTQQQTAWLFTFAEDNLVQFAESIEQDIPNTCQFIQEVPHDKSIKDISAADRDKPRAVCSLGDKSDRSTTLAWSNTASKSSPSIPRETFDCDDLKLGRFRQRVITAFC